MTKAPAHRMTEIVTGGICPATNRPITTFPDQNKEVSDNSKYASWNSRAPVRVRP
jgi:hypothetical protein